MIAEVLRNKKSLDIKEIISILPHRYPFLLVDKIVDMNFEENFIVGQKNLSINESFFQGHFPNSPIMPGVLIIEALAQTGAVFIALRGFENKTALLLSVNNAKFRHPVRPGDLLELRCYEMFLNGRGGKFRAEAFVSDKLAAQAEIGFALVDKNLV